MKQLFTLSALLLFVVSSGIAQACPPNKLLRVCTQKADKGIIIKDLTDKTNISGATIDFISLNNITDTLRFATNELGIVSTDKLLKGTEYNIHVSSVGYKPYFLRYKSSASGLQEIFMERDVVSNEEIVVISAGVIRCYSINFTCGGVPIVTEDSAFYDYEKVENNSFLLSSSVYPNPAQRGRNVNLELEALSKQNSDLQAVIIDMSGKTVWKQILKVNKIFTGFSINIGSQWAAGTYFLSLRNNNGVIVKTEKLIVL